MNRVFVGVAIAVRICCNNYVNTEFAIGQRRHAVVERRRKVLKEVLGVMNDGLLVTTSLCL